MFLRAAQNFRRVNLLRWSLKRVKNEDKYEKEHGVNLLRWSLKPDQRGFVNIGDDMCKFTPLEFETGTTYAIRHGLSV